jgi:hypothetical protein
MYDRFGRAVSDPGMAGLSAIPEQLIGTLLSAKVRHSTGTSLECEPVGLALKKARIFHFSDGFQNIMIFSVLLGFLGDQPNHWFFQVIVLHESNRATGRH